MLPGFPPNQQILELRKTQQLDKCLSLFANALLSVEKRDQSAFCKHYVQCTETDVKQHNLLRKAVFHCIYDNHALQNSSVETFFDIIATFGAENYKRSIDLLNRAPRGIFMKMGRLLLTIAEQSTENVDLVGFEQCVTVIFGCQRLAQQIINLEFTAQLKHLRSKEAQVLDLLVPFYASDAPIWQLISVFPDVSPVQGVALFARTKMGLEELTMQMLDDPDFINKQLASKPAKQKKFVVLDEAEKRRKEEQIREHNRKHFKYNFDEDDVSDIEESVEQLSAADTKNMALEKTLWQEWGSNKQVFDRKSRKTKERQALKHKLDWTDEQIEGWARMVGQQDKNKLNLPSKYKEAETYAPK